MVVYNIIWKHFRNDFIIFKANKQHFQNSQVCLCKCQIITFGLTCYVKVLKTFFPSFQVELYNDKYFSDIFKTYLKGPLGMRHFQCCPRENLIYMKLYIVY